MNRSAGSLAPLPQNQSCLFFQSSENLCVLITKNVLAHMVECVAVCCISVISVRSENRMGPGGAAAATLCTEMLVYIMAYDGNQIAKDHLGIMMSFDIVPLSTNPREIN